MADVCLSEAEVVRLIDALIYGDVVASRCADTADGLDATASAFHRHNGAACAVLYRMLRQRLDDTRIEA